MTPLNTFHSSASASLSPLVSEGQDSMLTPLPVEEVLPVRNLTEPDSTVTQPVEGKAKRRRKTKSEYAAMPRPEPKEKDKHKGGRPELAEEDKLKCVSSLVSIACYDDLQAISRRRSISVSQAIRWLIDDTGRMRQRQRMGQLTKRGLSEEERKQLRDLTGMAANLDQLAKLAHTEGYSAHATELIASAEKIRERLKAFNK